MVEKHAFGKRSLLLRLDFKVDHHPLLLTIEAGDAHQLIDERGLRTVIGRDRTQFLIQEFYRTGPVDLSVYIGKVEGHEVRKAANNGFLPWAVVGIRHWLFSMRCCRLCQWNRQHDGGSLP